MKILQLFLALCLLISLFLISAKSASAEINIFKPQLSWQRSTEASDKVVQETTIGSKVNEALQLPLDPSQTVFDNGVSTPTVNKNAVAAGIEWASWIQYSAPSPTVCGTIFELRRFQANLNLPANFNSSQVKKVSLRSPYYAGDTFPINDNAYIHINGNFAKRLGTNYGATNVGPSGTGPYANETDGWVANGDLGIASAGFLTPRQNTINIAAGERCQWGGMGKLELVLEIEGLLTPTPFLDLPWDYEGQGLSFSEAALAINSYFDHEYPLLSSGISEPSGTGSDIVNFRGPEKKRLPYSSHDGYDYGNDAKANLGNPVLAAASGCASYTLYQDGNNVIKLDHDNGYQTRYLHMLDDQFLITKSSTCVQVAKGQRIGSVGFSGTVEPPGPQGAHIHFMVIQDKNNDGNFEDNIPDGVTDPFGWQSTETDPWPSFAFNYGGQDRTGNESFYLWTKAIDNLLDQLTSNGGFFELERYKLEFPQGATNENLTLEMQYAPVAKPSNLLESIGATLVVNAKNFLGEFVEEFTKPYIISIDFSSFDLSTLNVATISIHSSKDGINWQREETIVDLENKKATAELNHLSHFALMAERLDIVAPTTTAILNGSEGQPNWFRSDVEVNLNAQDNTGGLGVDYTLYKVDDGTWQEYLTTLTISQVGNHTVEFYSVDKDENIEEIKSVSFTIDKTPPEAKIQFNPTTFKTEITGQDDNGEAATFVENNLLTKKTIITDKAGNNLAIVGINSKIGNSTAITIKSLSYNNGPGINFDFNKFYTLYSQSFNKLTYLSQSWLDADDVLLEIFYQTLTGKSTIYTKKPNQETIKEIRQGLVLLQVETNQGKLEYSY